jgi:hypothetical protein
VSPQPRPRSKRPLPDPPDEEVLTPDLVTDADGDVVDGDERPAPTKRDRRPLWALILGLSAAWFAFLGSILAFVLAPAAIVFGYRTMRRIDAGAGDPRERRKAKIGFITGIAATLFVVVQVILFAVYFKWDKTDEDLDLTTEKPAATTEAPPETTSLAPSTTLG